MPEEARPIRKVLGEQLRRIRGSLGWEQQELAARLKANGWPIDRSAIAKIEGATRNVSVEDLLALAATCDVEPVALLVPRDDEAEISVAGVRFEARGVRAWFHGLQPPAVGDRDRVGTIMTDSDHRHFYEQVSLDEWKARRHPVVEVIRNLAYVLEQSAAHDPGEVRSVLQWIALEAQREMDAIERGTSSFASEEST